MQQCARVSRVEPASEPGWLCWVGGSLVRLAPVLPHHPPVAASLLCSHARLHADVTSGVNTREKVKERDPRLAGLLSKVYGDGTWRYPATAPGKFEPWASSSSGSDGEAAASGAGSGKRQKRSGGGRKQPTAAAAPATAQQHEQQQQPRQVPVLVEHHSMTEPLLHGGGGSGISGVSRRRRGGSPSRHGGGGGGGSSQGLVPRRITRAIARLTGCCFGSL